MYTVFEVEQEGNSGKSVMTGLLFFCKHPFAPKKMPFRDKINKYDAIYC